MTGSDQTRLFSQKKSGSQKNKQKQSGTFKALLTPPPLMFHWLKHVNIKTNMIGAGSVSLPLVNMCWKVRQSPTPPPVETWREIRMIFSQASFSSFFIIWWLIVFLLISLPSTLTYPGVGELCKHSSVSFDSFHLPLCPKSWAFPLAHTCYWTSLGNRIFQDTNLYPWPNDSLDF